MNDLQKKELELLKIFIKICELLDIKYYLVCGSALGAAKYSGFIPWDDDIDVAMVRNDYEYFIEKAPSLLSDHLFLQNYKSDPEFPALYSKLRDSNTTYLEEGVSHLKINHGVCIDIFPLDGYPEKKIKEIVFELNKKMFRWKTVCAYKGNVSKKVEMRNKLFCLLGFHKKTNITLQKQDKLFMKYGAEYSNYWCNFGNWQGKLEYAPREQYGEGCIVKFEGIDVRIPQLYDQYLSQKYGNWKEDLPKDKQRSHHKVCVIDLNKSYKEYI